MHRSPGIYHTDEDHPRKTFDEGCANSHRLKWGPLPPNEEGRHNKPGKDKT